MPVRCVSIASAVCALCAAAVLFSGPVSASPGSQTLRTPGFALVGHGGVDRHQLRRLANRLESDLALVAGFLDDTANIPDIHIDAYPSLEAKGLASGYTLPVHTFHANREVHVALEPGFAGEVSLAVIRLALRDRLGRAQVDALETGLAALLVDDWRERGALYWAGRLAMLDDLHDVTRLVDSRWLHRQSDLVMTPIAAALVAFLVDRWGSDRFIDRYGTWDPSAGQADSLSGAFGTYLHRLRDRFGDHREVAAVPQFQRGFCHAHEGYQIHNGYLSAESDRALEKLADLGVNAVSITPFTYMRSARRAAALPFSSGAGSENDESVIHATLTARRLSMVVMLKPHVWMRGSWPGEIEMTSEAQWEAFFGHYYRWIRHYALMAEMYDIEVLCIGVELSNTTTAQARRWRELIAALRTVYRGRMTYAANWGDEFETTPLWEDLDYAAVNCYYPLSDSTHATDAELSAGVDRALDRIAAVGKRWGRRVVITEVGFTSTPQPWRRPYERRRDAGVDLEAQARCYDAFLRGLEGRSGIVGVYWWKWPSTLELGGPGHSGFTPNGKPAEKVVRRWYQSM